MRKIKKRFVLMSLMLLIYSFLSLSSVLGGFESFLSKATDGNYYEYDQKSLNNEYLEYQLGKDRSECGDSGHDGR